MFEAAAALVDPASIALVGGGSLAVAALRSTVRDVRSAVRALGPLLRGSPAREEAAARVAVRQVERIAETKGIACADHGGSGCAFVRRAATRLADAQSAEAFAAWGRQEVEARAARHGYAAAFWRDAADAAPSMGMAGTVLGLIGMFAAMDDPARLGPAMALALLTTLYGLVLGTILFGPAAARLARLSEAELRWQKAVLARLEALARAEASTTRQWLKRRARSPG